MRYFILSDVHANWEALQAVLQDMEKFHPRFSAGNVREETDTLVNLGDTVGYMPNPNEVMDALWPICNLVIPGNHDLEVAHLFRCSGRERDSLRVCYNEQAFWSLQWTRRALSPLNQKRLSDLVQRQRFVIRKNNLIFTHASPTFAERMFYVDCMKSAKELFFSHHDLNTTLAFVGHYHVPQIYTKEPRSIVAGGRIVFDWRNQEQPVPVERRWPLKTGDTALVVVPSVGQPRDHFYYTGYVIYDSANEQLIMRRIPYDVSKTQSTMRSLDFPPKLWERLTHGK